MLKETDFKFLLNGTKLWYCSTGCFADFIFAKICFCQNCPKTERVFDFSRVRSIFVSPNE